MSDSDSEKRDTHMSGFVSTHRTYKEAKIVKSEEMSEDRILVREFVGTVAEIGAEARMTINLGDFESVQVGVSVRLPAYVEELEEAYKAAKAFVDMKLNKEVQDIREYRASKRKGS